MGVKIFISATTKEFGDYADDLSSLRGTLTHRLRRLHFDPVYQGYIAKGGLSTPSELNLLVQESDLVVHLVGVHGGSAPNESELRKLRTELPEFEAKLPELAKLSPTELAAVTYTDWEAWLAVYHGKRLLVLEPLFIPGSRGKHESSVAEFEARQAHLKRLAVEAPAYTPVPVTDINEAVIVISETASGLEKHRLVLRSASSPTASRRRQRLRDIDREHNYFGHDEILESVRDELLAPADAKDKRERAIAIWGEPGIGKSTLLTFLREDAAIKATFSGGVFDVSFGKDVDESHSSVCLREWAEELGVPRDEVTLCKDEPDLREMIRNRIGDRRTLFLVDDVWVEALGRAIKINGSQSAYVFTTRTRKIANVLATPNRLAYRMTPISAEHSIALVRSIAESCFQVSSTITRQIESLVSTYAGLPLVLELIGESLKGMGDDAHEIECYLAEILALQKAAFPRAHQIFAPSFDRLASELQRGLARLSALKADPAAFSADLAKAVTKSPAVFSQLATQSELLRKVEAPARVYGCDEVASPQYYSINQSIADWLLDKLIPDEAREVYLIAVQYLKDQIRQGDELGRHDSDYEAWYRVEDPAWHKAMFDLRHYLIRAGEYKQLAFVLTNAWLCGFWWWDFYTDKDRGSYFCKELLDNWPILAEPDARILSEALADLKLIGEFYPRESDPQRTNDPQRWLLVRKALERVCERHSLSTKAAADSSREENELLGLVSLFIAETYRFGERDASLALRHFGDAVDLFGKQYDDDPDRWNFAWSELLLAACLRDFGRSDEADALCEKLLREEYAKKRPDHEILSRASLIRADHAMELGQVAQTVDLLHMAVYCAYRFQVYKSFSPHSGVMEPDEYTLRNYVDIAGQAATILLQFKDAAAGLDAALEVEARWREGPSHVDEVRAAFSLDGREDREQALIKAIFSAPLAETRWDDDEARRAYQREVLDRLPLLEAGAGVQRRKHESSPALINI